MPPPEFFDEDSEEELPPEIDAQIAQMAAQIPEVEIMPPDEDGPDEAQLAFEAEEARKQQAFETEEQRKNVQLNADIEREAAKAAAESDRKDAETVAQVARDEEQHRDEIRRKLRSQT